MEPFFRSLCYSDNCTELNVAKRSAFLTCFGHLNVFSPFFWASALKKTLYVVGALHTLALNCIQKHTWNFLVCIFWMNAKKWDTLLHGCLLRACGHHRTPCIEGSRQGRPRQVESKLFGPENLPKIWVEIVLHICAFQTSHCSWLADLFLMPFDVPFKKNPSEGMRSKNAGIIANFMMHVPLVVQAIVLSRKVDIMLPIFYRNKFRVLGILLCFI